MYLAYDNTLIDSWNETLAIVAELANVPVALIMKIENEKISVFGKNNNSDKNENPYDIGDNETLNGSGLYCEHVIKNQQVLQVNNALKDPFWDHNPDIKLNMIAYLGFPIEDVDGSPFGTLCILDHKEQHFSALTVNLLRSIKQSFESQLKQISYQNNLIADQHYKELLSLTVGIAHNVNTPLGVAITAASVLEHKLLPLAQLIENNKITKQKLLNSLTVMRESYHLLNNNLCLAAEQINHFREVGLDDNLQTLVSCDLKAEITKIISIYTSQLTAHNISYELAMDEYHYDKIETSPKSIQRILMILIKNSLDHAFNTEMSFPKISITLSSNSDNISLLYADNGIGLSEADHDKIFTPFFTTKRSTKNTGLGLSILKRIVSQNLNGSVSLVAAKYGSKKAKQQGIQLKIDFPYCQG